jgi:hypothetical protein
MKLSIRFRITLCDVLANKCSNYLFCKDFRCKEVTAEYTENYEQINESQALYLWSRCDFVLSVWRFSGN